MIQVVGVLTPIMDEYAGHILDNGDEDMGMK